MELKSIVARSVKIPCVHRLWLWNVTEIKSHVTARMPFFGFSTNFSSQKSSHPNLATPNAAVTTQLLSERRDDDFVCTSTNNNNKWNTSIYFFSFVFVPNFHLFHACDIGLESLVTSNEEKKEEKFQIMQRHRTQMHEWNVSKSRFLYRKHNVHNTLSGKYTYVDKKNHVEKSWLLFYPIQSIAE